MSHEAVIHEERKRFQNRLTRRDSRSILADTGSRHPSGAEEEKGRKGR